MGAATAMNSVVSRSVGVGRRPGGGKGAATAPPLPCRHRWNDSTAGKPWKSSRRQPPAATATMPLPLHRWNMSNELQPCSVTGNVRESLLENLSKLCEEGQLAKAVEVLDLLVQRGFHVGNSVFYGVLKKCIEQKNLLLGNRVHSLAVKGGYESDAFLANHIIAMYASHGRLKEATQVFTKVATPDRYMWASIILAHARNGQPADAIKLYRQMRESTVKPDSHIFAAVLKACAAAEDLFSGKEVHADMLGAADEPNVFVSTCLVDMYAKCGSLEDARKVFDNFPTRDVVAWNAMITGYSQHGLGREALALYAKMQQEGITSPNRVTFVSLLQACARVGALQEGKQLHVQIQERRLESDLVINNCLVDMYSKCGSLNEARRVFDNMPSKDVVTWTAIIAGYTRQSLGQEALSLYARMLHEGSTPADAVTFVCLLQACASVGAVHQAKQIHALIQERGYEADVVVGSSLVDMYAKCGSLKEAFRVFERLPTKNVVTWNAMLSGCAENSDGQMAIECFERMLQQGVKPDDTSFICLLVACSHAGLVQEGQKYFEQMEKHGIAPNVNHYNCMVDLLGRSGHLDEAENILQTMPFEDDVVGWTALLSACKSHSDAGRGRRCFDRLVELEPEDAAAYVLLGNIYANAGGWREVDKVENLRKSAGAWKKPARACIEVKSKVHEFTVGEDRSDISSKLRSVNSRIKEEGGHVPQTELVLKAVSEKEKEDALCGHAEKLALAYGLMNTPDGSTLLVTKNLRMCNDCHSGTKVMSHLEKREIIVRDGHRVHRFMDGSCSCGDRH